MKLIAGLILILLSYLVYGLFLNQYDIRIIHAELTPSHPQGYYDYSGVIGVQSQMSSGSGRIEDIIASAQYSNLDFIFFTDLNPESRPEGLAGYHNNLFVFSDAKYNYLNSRLLNLTSESDILQGPGRSQVLIADLLSQPTRDTKHGLFVLAHPFKQKYQWSGEYPPGLDGIEIINLKAMWQEAWMNRKVSFLWSLIIYPFNDRLALLRLFEEPKKVLSLWDHLSATRPTLGVASADADARLALSQERFVEFPSYKSLFNIVRNHILVKSELTGIRNSDQNKIAQALRNGNFYLSLDTLADPKGFLAIIRNKQNQVFLMGSTIKWTSGLELSVALPHKPRVPFDIVLYKNGVSYATANSQTATFNIHEPGVYRIKVRVIPTFPLPDGKKWVPWIYTNPFYIK